MLMTGFVRQSLHPGELSLESQDRWTRVLYPVGLFVLTGTAILLGIWGWEGARTIGIWWVSIVTLLLAGGTTALALRVLPRLGLPSLSNQWIRILRLEWLYKTVSWVYDRFHSLANLVTNSLEGEGGVLWSLLLLVLVVSILSTLGR
jgi:hypothetical protein